MLTPSVDLFVLTAGRDNPVSSRAKPTPSRPDCQSVARFIAMRLMGLVVLLLAAASPALAESADASVTVLRGASAPPPPAPPSVVVQTVVVPEIVYVPTYYYPAYAFFPGTFIQTRQFVHQQFSTMGLGHGRK